MSARRYFAGQTPDNPLSHKKSQLNAKVADLPQQQAKGEPQSNVVEGVRLDAPAGADSFIDAKVDLDESSDCEPHEQNESLDTDSTGSQDSPRLFEPKFVRHRPSTEKKQSIERDYHGSTLELINKRPLKQTSVPTVDDTDGLDPVGEYEEWVQRRRARKLREHERLASIEQEYEEQALAREANEKKPRWS